MIILTNTLEANVRTCIKTHNTISPPNLRKENDKFITFANAHNWIYKQPSLVGG